jgi:hypothetical protein
MKRFLLPEIALSKVNAAIYAVSPVVKMLSK